MSNHDTHHDSNDNAEKFEPLTDNNNNLSFMKAATLIIGLALALFGIVTFIVKQGGYLQNEEQVEWRVKHHAKFKDSDENKYYKTEKDLEREKEEMKNEETPAEEMKGEEKKAEENATEDKKPEEKKAEDKKAPAVK